MLRKTKKDILNGNIFEQILIFSVPLIGSYLLQQLYQFVDSIVLGRFAGVEAMAAVGGSSSMVINVVLNIITGIATGVMIEVAQSYGRNRPENVENAVKTGFFIAVVFGAILTIISCLLAKPLLVLLKCPQETIPLSLIYMFMYFASFIPYFVYTVGNYTLRAVGDSKVSLLFTIIIAVVKIVLDLLLTGLFKLGVWGVSISTFASYLVCGIVVLVILYRTPDNYHYDLKEFGYDSQMLKNIFKIGTPVAIQSAIFAATTVLVSAKINEHGTNAIAAFTAYTNVDNLYWCFSNAIGSSIMTLVGQNYGNKNMKRVKQIIKYGIIIHASISLVIGALNFFIGKYICYLFTSDPFVIDIADKMIKIMTASYVSYTLVEIISCAIKSCGDSLNSMIITIIGVCVVRILFLALYTFNTAQEVLLCYPLSWITTSLMFLIYYLVNKKYRLG